MVTFLTLLLGLTVGVQRIELAVDHRVKSIELRLDGQAVGTLSGEPWVLDCDFGAALVPHYLEAIARDQEGRELDRTLQRVNLPREAAEATLRLLGDDKGYRGAELGWRAADESEPEEIVVAFDGEPLALSGKTVKLPAHDLKTVHVLSAELIFPGQVRARVELAFGGEFGEEVASDLTSLALELDGSNELPTADQVESWLRIGEERPQVVAVERGPREVLLVRDEASMATLRGYSREASGSSRRGASVSQRMSVGVGSKDTLRLVGTRPMLTASASGRGSALFPVSAKLNNGPTSGLSAALINLSFPQDKEALAEMVAEAVGVAGLRAAGSNRVRVVLLVRSSESDGKPAPNIFEPDNVRGFLRELRVPLVYWRVGPTLGNAPDAWGEPMEVRGWSGIHAAITDLMDGLRPQFLVWIEGLHKPGDVTLAPEAPPGLRLAGAVAARVNAEGSRPSRRASPGGAG